MDKQKKPANDIRIGFNTRLGRVVTYCEKLLKEEKLRELNFTAVGGSIGTLVSAVEVIKTIFPGLYQQNRFATISYQSVEEGASKEVQNQRLYPKLHIILSLDKPAKLTEGFQDKLSEEERKKLLEVQNKRSEERKNRTRRGRGGMRRGGFRGRRGGFRGRRGFRGDRRTPFRGGRGFPPRRGGRPMRGRGIRGRGRGRGAPRQ